MTDTPLPPANTVGILALEVYTPSTYITQASLEEHAGVAAGKYTIGLGQQGLAITGDAEDINSICLTAVASLLEKYNINPAEVGRLEVGTETIVDKSKSTKTVLMDLFGGTSSSNNNTDIEGATVVNACYGGTAALLNAFLWCESSGWDGRYAIVVAADIATYARGPARPTSGCGAVAVLVGRDAPLVFDPKLRATHAAHTYDFFKPDHSVEYPVVDGALSQLCYYRALEDCYDRFCAKMEQHHLKNNTTTNEKASPLPLYTAESPDYMVFHAPYNKLVQKSYARLYLCDARRKHAKAAMTEKETEEKKQDCVKDPMENGDDTSIFQDDWLTMPMEQTYDNRDLDGVLKKLSAASFKQRLSDANTASQLVGNTYTASVFLGLASLIDRCGDSKSDNSNQLTTGKSIVVFSYGSGALATMYQLQVREPVMQTKFTIAGMAATMDLTNRLAQREQVAASELDHALETRARMHRAGAPYSPVYPTVGRLLPGTYYLNGVDSKWRRTYSRVPLTATMAQPPGQPLASPIVLRLAHLDAISHPVTGKLQVLASATDGNDQITEARRRVACVITGTAAGLPGSEMAFQQDNLKRLIDGNQCITPIPTTGIAAMLEKNVVQTVRLKDGTTKRVAVDDEGEAVKLAAQLGSFDLTASYGVSEGLAKTMDVAAQVAVAAGMEALKDAGLVSGRTNDPNEWLLPEQYRDTTGVVYASSFPAMDAAVGEVMRFLQSKTVDATNSTHLMETLRRRLERGSPNGTLSAEDQTALDLLAKSVTECNGTTHYSSKPYEFDRKFLFRVLVLGNAQLAQLAGCRGPNTQTNAACAGTTQAIAMAQDMLISGRAERVVVVAGDNASGSTLLPWLGSGFRALGAACTKAAIEDAAMPFDKRRSGMLLGAGGIGMVLETETSQIDRLNLSPISFQVKARLLATQYSNSAFHGAALDRKHIASEFKRFLSDIELLHGICKAEIASHGVYLSHETSTHASDASSCSGNEVAALREAFGDDLLSKMLILNTKGFTGHPMGVSFEDVTAVEVLMRQQVPPVVNYKEKDDYLGDLKISKGGHYACRYALRFAAGFGSQVAFALYATAQYQ